MGLEKGQQVLVTDLKEFLVEAEAGEFGDFSNKKYAAPKMALAEKLHELNQNVKSGKYD